MAQRVGVVLAGGSGSRLGQAKGAIELGGQTLAERAAAALWPHCGSVLISVGRGAVRPAPSYPSIEDPAPAGRGPLVGILAAFEATQQSDLLVLACDYPRVGADLLRRIVAFDAAEHDLIMPSDARGRDHPLVALWTRRTEAAVREAVAEGRHKVRALFGEWRIRRLAPADLHGIDLDRALLNVNWPEELERIRDEETDGAGPG